MSLSQLWNDILIFLIPVGGGIPAGVLLARDYGFNWFVTAALYFVSDILLALMFEPLLIIFIKLGKRIQFLAKFSTALKNNTQKMTSYYGSSGGPFTLLMISFGVDPMTGRATAVAAGHGFISGWLIAITGDMFYFAVLMISTLWLDNLVGNGTWTTLIILAIMMGLPILFKRLRKAKSKN